VPEPTEDDVAAYYHAHGMEQPLVEVADSIRDLLRHEARGRATEAFVAELREKATIEYK
jgi:hypothetical protein